MLDSEPGGQSLIVLAAYPGILICFVLVIFFALLYVFARAYEASVLVLDQEKLEDLKDAQEPKMEALFLLRSDRRGFLYRIGCIRLFSLIFLSTCFSLGVQQILSLFFTGPFSTAAIVIAILSLLFLLFVIVSVMEEVPELLAQERGVDFALKYYVLFKILDKILQPIAQTARKVSNGILAKRNIDPKEQSIVLSEQELKEIIEQSSEEEDSEYGQILLENVFDFDEKNVSDSMTHRMDVVAIEKNASFDEVVELFEKEGYSRIPVYEDDIDHIIGIVHSRDVLLAGINQEEEHFTLQDVLRETSYTPETQPLSSLFVQMQEDNLHMAIVIDEYGGTAGIITMEDVLEELVGQIDDEYDEEEIDFLPLGDHIWQVSSWLALEDLEEYLDADFPGDEFDTVAGLVLSLLDRIPEESETPEVRYKDYVFKVEEMDDRRIEKLTLRYEPLEIADEDSPIPAD